MGMRDAATRDRRESMFSPPKDSRCRLAVCRLIYRTVMKERHKIISRERDLRRERHGPLFGQPPNHVLQDVDTNLNQYS